MSGKFIFSFLLFFIGSRLLCPALSQKTRHYDLAELLKKGELITSPSTQTQVLENTLAGAISTKGVIWLKHIRFRQGTINIDLRGRNVFLKSFLGIAFHGRDTSTYDVLYFRPFNFKHPDTLRRRWSVQYVSLPQYSWDKLRKEHPLVYENLVTPAPNPDD